LARATNQQAEHPNPNAQSTAIGVLRACPSVTKVSPVLGALASETIKPTADQMAAARGHFIRLNFAVSNFTVKKREWTWRGVTAYLLVCDLDGRGLRDPWGPLKVEG